MSRKRFPIMEPVSRDFVERLAYILGESSAAADALRDLDARLERGENAAIFQSGNYFVVGPAPADKVTL